MARRKSLKALEAEIRKLQAQAERLKNEEKPGVKELRAVVAKFKLKPADIQSALKASGGRKVRKGKVAPKYRNPKKKTETWSGRGRQPRWLVPLLKQGKKLEEFAIS